MEKKKRVAAGVPGSHSISPEGNSCKGGGSGTMRRWKEVAATSVDHDARVGIHSSEVAFGGSLTAGHEITGSSGGDSWLRRH
ncbi:unnamed protein product [Lactuca virosa]|uniref:Uncharacterized protein n=1 Tax=Lactuca virosa TaxID=75947 RepID=A0AAU9NFC6_9ASTR|nr:unnamed protein product [Lactuca virosa]